MQIKRSQKIENNFFGEDFERQIRILYPEDTVAVKNNLTNKTFGKLTVLYRLKSKWDTIYWMCRCDCGEYFVASTNFLETKSIPNCGCLKEEVKERRKKKQEESKFVFDGEFLVIKEKKNTYIKKTQLHLTDKITLKKIKVKSQKINKNLIKGSIGEQFIHQILEDNNIPFVREVSINLPDNSKGRFDFFVNNSYFIEYDGEQHTKVVDRWGGEEGLKHRQEKDDLKNEYCMLKRIPLIRIPYTVENISLEDLILETSSYVFYNGEEINPDDIYYLCHES